MKKVLLLLPFLLISFLLSAQIGFNAGYSYMRAKSDVYGSWVESGSVVGANYWFRLKNKRIEFLPSVEISRFLSLSNEDRQLLLVGAYWNTKFYIFDFQGDCNCPTFSKHGNTFGKGFFLSVSPGIEYGKTNIDADDETSILEEQEWLPTAAIGAGLDFGISDLLTLTPYAQFRFAQSNGTQSNTTVERFVAGINIGLRFDK
jgi:hypothetical protein